ncbi:MAG: PIN domain-containing protein [Tagaea sp.]|nr:PIN domain-containing protein [Tagaea sp.]
MLYAGLRSANGASRVWLSAAIMGRVRPVASTALWIEYEAVLTRRGALAEFGLSSADVMDFLDRLAQQAIRAIPRGRIRPLTRDPDDDLVVEAALAGQAALLLTFNTRDFVTARGLGFEIATPGAALARYRNELEES